MRELLIKFNIIICNLYLKLDIYCFQKLQKLVNKCFQSIYIYIYIFYLYMATYTLEI